ncbi:8880_t:CDS:2, partial [Acaulospora morrowiae]
NSVEDPELLSRKTSVVNTNVQYCSVAKTALGKNKIIMGAEVDCIGESKPERHLDPINNYIELKTSRIIKREEENYKFEKYKLLKFWAQSFLIGIPRIIVGFRDDNGIVKNIREFKTMEIPRMVRGKNGMWDAAVCLNFANEFFDWLKTIVIIDDPRSSYTISYKHPFQSIEVTFSGSTNSVLAERHL